MFNTPEQFADSQKAQFQTLLSIGQKAFEGVEKLVSLNMAAARASMEESAQQVNALLSAKDAQELVSLQANLAQPAAEKALSYSRQVYEIASATSADLAKLVELQIAEGNKKVVAGLDQIAKNAPAGSEGAVALVKSALSAANSAFDSVQKATKQAVEVAEQNMNAAAAATVKAAGVAPKAAKKA